MRSEELKKIYVYIMAVLLLLTIPSVYIRLQFCVTEGTPTSLETITGTHGRILDRTGAVIYDEKGCVFDEFINVVGARLSNGNHVSERTLAYKFKNELVGGTISVLAGTKQAQASDGCTMTTTLLPGEALVTLHKAFRGYNGTVFAYNYMTGEIYVMLSLPSNLDFLDEVNDPLHNDNLGTYMPGSCFKIVSAVCALAQDPALAELSYTCTGSYTLRDETTVTCGGAHGGPLDLTAAIGRSCNCYFAMMIAEHFDVGETQAILRKMNITVQGDGPQVELDRLKRATTSTEFDSTGSNSDVWNMIGEIGTKANMIDLACIAGAIANGGSAAKPYLIESIYDPNRDAYIVEAAAEQYEGMIGSDVAGQMLDVWRNATDDHYRSGQKSTHALISCAKTGTAEIGEGNNRLVLGLMEQYDLAFVVAVEGLPAGEPLMLEIANTLAELVPQYLP